jgi:hypothetical protein
MSDNDGNQPTEISTLTSSASAFVLTVTGEFGRITVTGGGHTDTCPAGTTCNFAYLGGTALTIKAQAQNLIDCFKFTNWLGACSGQSATCNLVINSDLSTTAVYGPLSGCIPQ